MKVLLTGGKGMLGRTLCAELKDFEEFLDTLAKMAKPKGDEENG